MRMSKFFVALMLVMVFMGGVAMADDYDLAYKRLGELEVITTEDTGDKIVVWDATDNNVKTMSASGRTGDVAFRTTLLAMGRANGASTAASSSTNLAPANLPYAVLIKYVGGNNALDETDGGTRLQNGTPGQVLTFIIGNIMTNGSWIITPATTTGFTSITMDTKGDLVTLLYVNDTIGWIILSATGVTIAQA